MAKIGFDSAAYKFTNGYKILRDTYQASAIGLHIKILQIREELRAYEEAVANGAPDQGDIDFEGNLLWSQDQVLRMDIENLEDAQMHLRKAFVIALYHHWERSIRAWADVPTDKQQHKHLAAYANKKGLSLHKRLDAVRDLANVLKHNSRKYADCLLTSWKEVMRGDATLWVDNTDFYSLVNLREIDIEEVFDIIKDSGPQIIITTAEEER